MTGVTRRHSLTQDGAGGNNYSRRPSVSANGKYIVFESGASDFVSNDDNLVQDVFLARGLDEIFTSGFE